MRINHFLMLAKGLKLQMHNKFNIGDSVELTSRLSYSKSDTRKIYKINAIHIREIILTHLKGRRVLINNKKIITYSIRADNSSLPLLYEFYECDLRKV